MNLVGCFNKLIPIWFVATFTILLTKRTSNNIHRAMKQTIKSQYCSHDYGHLSIAKTSQEKLFDLWEPVFAIFLIELFERTKKQIRIKLNKIIALIVCLFVYLNVFVRDDEAVCGLPTNNCMILFL